MLHGFNHNLRHKDHVFHVQTEDGGLKNPVVETMLFLKGNVLLKRQKSYAKFVKAPNREEIVLAIMKEQHKEVMKALVEGRIRSVTELLRENTQPDAHVPEESQPSKPVPSPPLQNLRTLDTADQAEKTLDELILEFLSEESRTKT